MMFNARVESIQEPLTLDDVKMHLRTILGDTTEDESILRPLIAAAREYAEGVAGRSFAAQTIDAYPEGWGVIRLPRPPIASVESIVYRDENGDENTLDPERYAVDLVDAKIYIKDPPLITLDTGHPIKVTYKAGGVTPSTARQAMLLLIGHWYNNREAVVVGSTASVEVSMTVRTLLNAKKDWWF